jgi:dihydroorotate dehydrogenase electron transfer subunit
MHVENAQVVSHTALTGGYRLLTMMCPAIADDVKAGQFVHLRVPQAPTLCLRRPFSIYKAEDGSLSVLYKEVGEGTRAMQSIRQGDEVSVIGPLGNGFPLSSPDAMPVLVGGGYGVAPLSLLAKNLQEMGIVFIGGQSAQDILCEEDFNGIDWPVRVATEDGSGGGKGLVTDVLDDWLDEVGKDKKLEFYACGPEGMLRAVSERALARGRPAWISLDRHMGCGVGVCLACVQMIKSSEGVEEWARTCKDGPVFEGRQIVW